MTSWNGFGSDDGRIFVAGWNCDGQLGLGFASGDDVLMLRHMPTLEKVKFVACGWKHTLAITGDMYNYI